MTTTYEYTQREDVDSSAIHEVAYDGVTKTMYVVFHSGRIAAYGNVESSTFDAFVTAESVGRFYNMYVQAKLPGVSVDQSYDFAPRDEQEEKTEDRATRKVRIVYDKTVVESCEAEYDAETLDDAMRQFAASADLDGEIRIRKVEILFD